MGRFDYDASTNATWPPSALGCISFISQGKRVQELYPEQRLEEFERLIKIAKVQSTKASTTFAGSSIESIKEV